MPILLPGLPQVCSVYSQTKLPKEDNNHNHVEAEQPHAHDDWALWTISGGPNEGYHVTLQMNGQSIQMELDTGAAISVTSEVEWNKLFPEVQLQKYQGGLLRGYSGCQLEVKGQADVNVTYGRQYLTLPLVVMAGHHRPALLGRNWLSHLHLDWTEVHILQNDGLQQQLLAQHTRVFQPGVGTITGYKTDIRLTLKPT